MINRIKMIVSVGGLVAALSSAGALAETYKIGQKDKAFTGDALETKDGEQVLEIKKGDVVRFINKDSFFHNVYSLSDTKMFDLGSFPEGEHRDVTFDKAGRVKVQCAIHPDMKMFVEVTGK